MGYAQVQLEGTVTEVKHVDVHVDIQDIIAAAIEHIEIYDISKLLYNKISKKFINQCPELKNAEYNPYKKVWEKFDFVDYHKKENVYKIVREPTDAEFLAFSIIADMLNQLK